MITIVVEDGTGVVGANSYASVEQLVAYAEQRGISLPADVEEQKRLLIRAMDFIETRTHLYSGLRRDRLQTLSFPRIDFRLDGWYLEENTIPDILVEAQLDIAANSVGIDVLPVLKPASKGAVKQTTVGPVSVTYADADDRSRPYFPRAEALLRRLQWRPASGIAVTKA